jgi:ankyrin repeat protein
MAIKFFEFIKDGELDEARRIMNEHPAILGSRNENGISPVLFAAYLGRDDMLGFLLSNMPRLDIYEASAVGDLETVHERVRSEPELVNSFAPDGFTPLGLASFFGREAVVEALLEAGAAPGLAARHNMGVAPLHSAVATKRGTIARRLVESGADVNARQQGGFTPLHGAAHNGDRELVEFLIASGADIHARTDDGKTASDLAREQGHEQLAVALSEIG